MRVLSQALNPRRFSTSFLFPASHHWHVAKEKYDNNAGMHHLPKNMFSEWHSPEREWPLYGRILQADHAGRLVSVRASNARSQSGGTQGTSTGWRRYAWYVPSCCWATHQAKMALLPVTTAKFIGCQCVMTFILVITTQYTDTFLPRVFDKRSHYRSRVAALRLLFDKHRHQIKSIKWDPADRA